MSNFDIEKFRKVRAMMDGGATPGERAAAKARAEAIAAKVGWDLLTAIQFDDAAKRDADPKPSRGSTMQTWEEYWERGRAEREARVQEAERQHGPWEAAFAERDRERKLREALAPIAVISRYTGGKTISGFGTWTVGVPDEEVKAHLERAFPLPTSLSEAMNEWQEWEDLQALRYAYDRDVEPKIHVRCRVDALEAILDTEPATSWTDLDIRMNWRRSGIERDRWHDIDVDIAMHDQLVADLAFLRSESLHSSKMDTVSTTRRTNADKRRDVLSMLDASPELSDREIARRVGVSPQTVGNCRRRAAQTESGRTCVTR